MLNFRKIRNKRLDFGANFNDIMNNCTASYYFVVWHVKDI